MNRIIGVLSLQGGYASHIAVLRSLGMDAREIRTEAELSRCDALVIPGGESTVLTRLLMKPGTGPGCGAPWEPLPFHGAIRDFARANPVMGTCAGLIMLARPCGDERVVSFDVLPVNVERNAYGRQTESFIEGIDLDFPGGNSRKGSETPQPYPATFIRAPKIVSLDKDVRVLARAKNRAGGTDPVMVRHGLILGLTFHPELTPHDTRIHEYFLAMR